MADVPRVKSPCRSLPRHRTIHETSWTNEGIVMRTAGKLTWSPWIFVAVVTVAVLLVAARTGPMSSGAVVDDQLRRSQDPAYVAALEAHQREIERMLGGGTP